MCVYAWERDSGEEWSLEGKEKTGFLGLAPAHFHPTGVRTLTPRVIADGIEAYC